MSTLSSTFFLKKPKIDSETLILFSCYFKYESKKFVYSTGEKIKPQHWDFKNHQPKMRGGNKSPIANSIQTQLNRYKEGFSVIQARAKTLNEQLTSKKLKEEFDIEFKKAPSGKNLFFDAFDEFIEHKTKLGDWSLSTIKRYWNIKNILLDFESSRNFKLNFNAINSKFHAEFTDYSLKQKQHINNTFARNLGLFKTFMAWALREGYTYNDSFKDFKPVKKVITRKVALSLSQLMSLWNLELESKRLEQTRDLFIFQAMIGCRDSDLSEVRKENTHGGYFLLKEEKDGNKEVRKIPLNETAQSILRKYDYKLPVISNQKRNDYIKEVCKIAGFNQETEEVQTRGNERVIKKAPLYQFISTHVARRTAVTTMKRAGMPDKAIMSITGHKDAKTFNQYYIVEDEDKKQAVSAISLGHEPLRKVQ